MNKKTIILALSFYIISNIAIDSNCPINLSNVAYSREASQEDIQRYSTYYANGLEEVKNQDYDNAINSFKKVIRFSPYDTMTLNSLANAYYERGLKLKQEKTITKALNDFRSAVFYSRYWSEKNQNQTLSTISANAAKEIVDCEKRLNILQDTDSRLKQARALKANRELAASGYLFQQLKNSKYKETIYSELANIYKNLNNQAAAFDCYKSVLDINPKNAQIHFLYGVLLDEVGNYEASMEQYSYAFEYGDKSPELLAILENKWQQNIVNNPNDAQSYANLGAIYQKQGNLDNAKVQYLKAYNLDSNDETIINNLASLYNQQKDYQNAIAMYDRILSKKPKDIAILNLKAQAYKNLNQYDEALHQYERILAINPQDKSAQDNIGDIVYNYYSGEKLQNYLMVKAQNSPNDYDSQFNYAIELHKNKNLAEAIKYYQKAISINPSKEEPYLNLAQIYIDKKDYSNAKTVCEKGLIYIPNNAKLAQNLKEIKEYDQSSQYDLATSYFEKQQYQKAIAEYNKIQNKTKEVKLAIASCYWQMKDYQNANRYYLELLTKEPNNTEILESSAWAYYSLEDYTNAQRMAQRVLALNPQNQDMKNLTTDINNLEASNSLNSAIKKYEQQDYIQALNLFNKILAKTPNDEFSIYYKGLCLDELKKPQEAMVQYRSLISKNPQFASAYYSLALNLDNSENYQEAVKNYEKFIELKTKSNESDETTTFAIARIKELKEYLTSISKK